MFGTLLLREILDHLRTARVGIALAGMGLLAVVVALVGTAEHERRLDDWRQVQVDVRRHLEQVHVYDQLDQRVARPPEVLSVFCQGVDRTAGQLYEVSPFARNASLRSLGDAGNDLMKDFVGVDFTAIVLVVFSFVAVALGHGAVAGEAEDGTLAATLANPVPRAAVIAAKLVGGWVVLCLPLTLAFVAAAVVTTAHPDVHLDASQWLRLVLYLGLCALFLATIYALSVMVSTCTRRSASALVVCLLAWLVGGVGFLNALPFVARYGIAMVPYESFLLQARQIYGHLGEQVQAWHEAHPQPPPAFMQWREVDGIVRYGHPRGYAWQQARNAYVLELRVDAADETYRQLRAAYEPLAQMAYAVDRWSLLSPLTNFATLARQLSRTTLDDTFYFLRAAYEYRRTYIDYLRGKDAFASRRWFSDDPPDQVPMLPDPGAVTDDMLAPGSAFQQQLGAWVEAQERDAAHDPRRRLDLSDLPPFTGEGQRTLGQSLAIMTPGLAVMLLTLALAVVISVARMERYDPRP